MKVSDVKLLRVRHISKFHFASPVAKKVPRAFGQLNRNNTNNRKMARVYGAKQIQICHSQRAKASLKIYIGLALPYLAVAAFSSPSSYQRNSHISYKYIHENTSKYTRNATHTTRLWLWWCIIINIFQKVLYFTLGKFMKSVTAFTIVIY